MTVGENLYEEGFKQGYEEGVKISKRKIAQRAIIIVPPPAFAIPIIL